MKYRLSVRVLILILIIKFLGQREKHCRIWYRLIFLFIPNQTRRTHRVNYRSGDEKGRTFRANTEKNPKLVLY